MANLRALVKRRKAVRNIRKITRTMELIATARFKKALDRATEADAYTRKIAELAADLSRNAGEVSHPLLATRPVKKSLLLVITSNRGLCGGYNGAIIREAITTVTRASSRPRSTCSKRFSRLVPSPESRTAMRSGPPAGAQIEYERRMSSPPIVVRNVRCCPGSKRNSSRSVSGTSNVIAIASRVSRSTFATASG